jgi:cytochrome b561
VRDIHQYLGLAVAGLFLVLSLWGLFQWIRNADPGSAYYKLLAAAQIGLVLQVIVGAVMFLFVRERNMDPLHFVYGGFPILVLIFAHRYSRKLEGLEWVAFALAGLFIFGLQLRGYMTGMEGT